MIPACMRRPGGVAAWIWIGLALLPAEPASVRAQDIRQSFPRYQSAFASGNFKEADRIAREALKWCDATGDARASPWSANLAHVCMRTNRPAEAESLYRRALPGFKQRAGERSPETINVIAALGRSLSMQGRYEDADSWLSQALALRIQVNGPESAEAARLLSDLGEVSLLRRNYEQADGYYRRVLAISGTRAVGLATVQKCLYGLAMIAEHLGQFDESERILLRLNKMEEKQLGPSHPDSIRTLSALSTHAIRRGRYDDAELLVRRVVQIATAAKDALELAVASDNYGLLMKLQNRSEEAVAHHLHALAIWETLQGGGPDGSSGLSTCLYGLANAELELGRLDRAEEHLRRSMAIDEKNPSAPPENLPRKYYALATLEDRRGRPEQAEALYREALARREKAYGGDHPEVALTLYGLGHVLIRQKKFAEAQPLLDRALAIMERSDPEGRLLFGTLQLRAEVAWEQGRRDAALADLGRALDIAERERSRSVGAGREVSTAFAQFTWGFEQMVAWQSELGNVAGAFSAAERSRARSLLDEMRLAGSDLDEGRPSEERASIRRRQTEINGRITALEGQLEQLRPDQSKDRARLFGELEAARGELYAFDRDTRTSSRVYRRLLAQGESLPTLADIQSRLLREGDLLLVYVLGDKEGFVFVVRPDSARIEKLELTADAATTLGASPGPLSAEQLRGVLVNEKKTGVLQRLSDRGAALPVDELAALWTILTPETERAAITEGKVKRLLIVPDGPLAMLPIEALVVGPGKSPRYLLDVGPPLVYGPSAASLLRLAERDAEAVAAAGREPVLALGDPAYPEEGAGALSRYRLAGGKLTRLPFSRLEAQWVVAGFSEAGIKAVSLIGPTATERGFRHWAPGRKIVHLACHGLVDQRFENVFGSLALTPGPAANDPADDGFLTLREVYDVDLRGCELALLSACQTNLGAVQRGEGTWAMSRGFLVAGARRVVASNWVVDDEAAASLLSVYCARLARAEAAGKSVDYADALREAKRWVRGHDAWKAPYYWASLVLVGPT